MTIVLLLTNGVKYPNVRRWGFPGSDSNPSDTDSMHYLSDSHPNHEPLPWA